MVTTVPPGIYPYPLSILAGSPVRGINDIPALSGRRLPDRRPKAGIAPRAGHISNSTPGHWAGNVCAEGII